MLRRELGGHPAALVVKRPGLRPLVHGLVRLDLPDVPVLSRSELMQRVWGYEASVLSRTVDTHMAELRRKLEPDPAEPRYLLTVRKAGYRLER